MKKTYMTLLCAILSSSLCFSEEEHGTDIMTNKSLSASYKLKKDTLRAKKEALRAKRRTENERDLQKLRAQRNAVNTDSTNNQQSGNILNNNTQPEDGAIVVCGFKLGSNPDDCFASRVGDSNQGVLLNPIDEFKSARLLFDERGLYYIQMFSYPEYNATKEARQAIADRIVNRISQDLGWQTSDFRGNSKTMYCSCSKDGISVSIHHSSSTIEAVIQMPRKHSKDEVFGGPLPPPVERTIKTLTPSPETPNVPEFAGVRLAEVWTPKPREKKRTSGISKGATYDMDSFMIEGDYGIFKTCGVYVTPETHVVYEVMLNSDKFDPQKEDWAIEEFSNVIKLIMDKTGIQLPEGKVTKRDLRPDEYSIAICGASRRIGDLYVGAVLYKGHNHLNFSMIIRRDDVRKAYPDERKRVEYNEWP